MLGDGLRIRGMPDRPSRPGERIALAVTDLTEAEMAAITASTPDGPGYDLADLDEAGRLVGTPEYDPSALRVLANMAPPPRRPAGHVDGLSPTDGGPGARSLREEVREGTLRRMRRALIEAEAVLQRLLDGGCLPGDERIREAEEARDRLIASIKEVA